MSNNLKIKYKLIEKVALLDGYTSKDVASMLKADQIKKENVVEYINEANKMVLEIRKLINEIK